MFSRLFFYVISRLCLIAQQKHPGFFSSWIQHMLLNTINHPGFCSPWIKHMLLNTITHPGFCSPWIKFMLLNTINHIGFCLTHVAQHNQSSWIFLHPGFNTCCSTRSSWMFLNWMQHVGWRKIQARASIASTCPSSRRWQVACS